MSIGILSCVWQRPERLAYTLSMLDKQTDEDWHLYLINNNPALRQTVNVAKRKYKLPMTVVHNNINKGPYARWLVAQQHVKEHSHFMTLDDDLNFDKDLLKDWQKVATDEVMGWNGFIFQSDYWHRQQVEIGEICHYVWGSNMLVPAEVVAEQMVTDLAQQYWQCDDLWVCYIASHIQGKKIRRANIDVSIQVDGKDTYPGQHRNKVLFLESLRRTGWAQYG